MAVSNQLVALVGGFGRPRALVPHAISSAARLMRMAMLLPGKGMARVACLGALQGGAICMALWPGVPRAVGLPLRGLVTCEVLQRHDSGNLGVLH